jgi:hypothetical protein
MLRAEKFKDRHCPPGVKALKQTTPALKARVVLNSVGIG